MQNLMLHDIRYTELDTTTMTWCATAQVRTLQLYHDQKDNTCLSAPQIAHHQRQQQRAGVRLLLKSLLKKLDIVDILDESSFPYRLTYSQLYVCFSHTSADSKNTNQMQNDIENSDIPYIKVAVIISRHRTAGIDIEVNAVKWQVAKRFYHPRELAMLHTMPLIQRDNVVKWLWQIKESFIKIHQYTLAQGLGMDYSVIAPDLIKLPTENLPWLTMIEGTSGYRISIIPSQQTVIIY